MTEQMISVNKKNKLAISKSEFLFLLREGDKYFERNPALFNKFILKAIDFLRPNSNDTILEVGCGTGSTLNKLKLKYGSNVYGLDPSRKAITYGKNKYKLNNLYTNTFLNFSNKKKFDIIINGGFFYLTPDSIIKRTLIKISKMMKVNSYFVFWDYDTPYCYSKNWKHDKRIKVYKRDYLKLIYKINLDFYLILKKQFIEIPKLFYPKELRYSNNKIDNIVTMMIFKKINKNDNKL
jgi:SAM-dependent methyltransferase